MDKPVLVHTDGSGINRKNKWNSGHGGCGVVLQYGDKIAQHSFGRFDNTTSARMEIFAIIKALEIIKPGFDIHIHTDNQYCKNTISKLWFDKWLFYGADKKNLDLWKRFQTTYNKHISGNSKIEAIWVKGHNGNRFNEMADKLAEKGRKEEQIVIIDDRNGIYEI